MEGFGWLMTTILGGLAGWIAVGALLGNWLLALAGIVLGGLLGQLIVAVAGACILILAYRAFQGRTA